MKKKKVNWILYLGLMLLSVGIILSSLAVKKCNEWFTIISSIGCGAFASVIIAFLIEIVNIVQKKQNDTAIFESYFSALYFNFSLLLFSFMEACDKDARVGVEKACWFDWLERLSKERLATSNRTIETFLVDKFRAVQKEFEKIEDNKLMLLSLDLIEEEEFVTLSQIKLDLSIIERELERDRVDWSTVENVSSNLRKHIENSEILKKFNKATYKDSLLDLIFIRCYLKKDIVIPSNKQ